MEATSESLGYSPWLQTHTPPFAFLFRICLSFGEVPAGNLESWREIEHFDNVKLVILKEEAGQRANSIVLTVKKGFCSADFLSLLSLPWDVTQERHVVSEAEGPDKGWS